MARPPPGFAVAPPSRIQAVPLTIVCGPANCGKVALLVQRFLDAVDGGQNPFLVVPNRSDAELVERELLRRRGAVLGGSVGTFDDLFGLVLERSGEAPLVLSPAQRRLVLAEVIGAAELETLAAPARSPGFADGLARMFDELTVSDEPAAVVRRLAGLDGGQRFDEIRALRAAYLERLAALGALDRAGMRARGAELVASRLDAWDGAPVLAHGFEDVTGVQLAALRALAGRGPVTVSLPYETGREAFAAVRPAMDALTAGPHELVELPPGGHADSPVLLHLERSLFALRDAGPAPEPDGSVVLLEACGMRGVADQVAAEALRLVREDRHPAGADLRDRHRHRALAAGAGVGVRRVRAAGRGGRHGRAPDHGVRRRAARAAPVRLVRRRPRPTCSATCAALSRACCGGRSTMPRAVCAAAA